MTGYERRGLAFENQRMVIEQTGEWNQFNLHILNGCLGVGQILSLVSIQETSDIPGREAS
jgi:hypothetical protein